MDPCPGDVCVRLDSTGCIASLHQLSDQLLGADRATNQHARVAPAAAGSWEVETTQEEESFSPCIMIMLQSAYTIREEERSCPMLKTIHSVTN